MEEGKDALVMDLCRDTTPENQEFILQEVSECAAFPAVCLGLCDCGSQVSSLAWSLWVSDTGNFTWTLGGDCKVRVCGYW